ncbi:MAG: PH domain-containing protein, partial [Muribaculaceae bacterium]|nr:PH domain-containing protein [Muribaculaceae bacterium]
VFPDKLIIDDDYVIYQKSRVIGRKQIRVKQSSIGSVSIDKHVLFADIIIETNGGQKIVAHGFTRSDAKEIAELLE